MMSLVLTSEFKSSKHNNSYKRWLNLLLAIGIMSTPMYNVGLLLSLFKSGLYSALYYKSITPWYIKTIKDVIILLIFVNLILFAKHKKLSFAIFLLLVLLFAVLPAYFVSSLPALLFGYKWIIPLLMVPLFSDSIDVSTLSNIADSLFYLCIILITSQFIEFILRLKNQFHYYRIPGFYIIPNTTSFLWVLSLYAVLFFSKKKKHKQIMLLLSPIGVFLTHSGTGFLGLALVLAVYCLRQRKGLIPLGVLLSMLITVSSLSLLTGRKHLLQRSFLNGRVNIFLHNLSKTGLSPYAYFGRATQTAFLVNQTHMSWLKCSKPPVMTDSTFSQILANLGLLYLLIFISIIFSLMLWSIFKQRMDFFVFLGIYTIFGFTTTISGAFPMNLLFSVFGGYYMGKYLILPSSKMYPKECGSK